MLLSMDRKDADEQCNPQYPLSITIWHWNSEKEPIMQQAALQHMMGNHKIFGCQARAIQDLVARRGGLENLGWDGYVASLIRQILSAWSVMQEMHHGERMIGTMKGLSQGRFVYPTHPFPSELSKKAARFSSGFREAALRTELSLQFIDYLNPKLEWVCDESGKVSLKTSNAHEILGMPKLSAVERLLGTAVQSYINHVEGTEHARKIKVTEESVQSQIHVLAAHKDITKCDRNLLTWACLMLCGTTSEQTDAWRWANQWLCSIDVSEHEIEKLGRMFPPIPIAGFEEG